MIEKKQTKTHLISIEFGDQVHMKGFVIGLFLYVSILLYSVKMSTIFFISIKLTYLILKKGASKMPDTSVSRQKFVITLKVREFRWLVLLPILIFQDKI